MVNSAWLSQGVESLREQLRATRSAPWDCDVLVVGSGYGGAVAAARLAGRRSGGRVAEVWVIERGREWLPGTFPARLAELPAAVRFSMQDGAGPRGNALGLYDVRLGPDVNVLVANGLGGGSLINAAVMARPADDVFLAGWPKGIGVAAMERPYCDAEQMLQVQPFVRPDKRPPKLQALDKLAALWAGNGATQALAAPLAVSQSDAPTPAGVDRRACIACGDCVTGCNWQAKNSLDVNYLALACQRGARLFTGTLALSLRKTLHGQTVVWEVDAVPTLAPAATQPDEARLVVRARRVVVAAGTLGSTELLLRSRAAGLCVSGRLGERFSTNGDAIHGAVDHPLVTRINASDATEPAERKIGPTITGMVRHQHDGQAFVVQEFGIPAPLHRVLAEVTCVFGLLPREGSTQPPPDETEDPLAAGDAALTHTMIYGALGDDGAGGRIVAPAVDGDAWDARVRIDWPDAGEHPVFGAQFDALRAAHEGVEPDDEKIGGIAVANPVWQPLPLPEAAKGPATTVHPLGGCAMADSAEAGVVDACGRVFDPDGGTAATHEGLAVLDGSIVPRALAINPALTIAALAERAVRLLAADWGLDEPAWRPAPGPLPQLRWQEPQRASGSGTATVFEEALEGRLTFDAKAFRGRLELRFEPVPDLLSFVSTRDRRMTLQAGRLLLYPDPASGDVPGLGTTPAAPGQAPDPLWVYPVTGCMLVLQPSADLLGGIERLIDYELTVAAAKPGGPLPEKSRLLGRKRLHGAEGTNPLRQLSVMALHVGDPTSPAAGSLEVDLGDFVRRRSPLLSVLEEEDYPTALADLGAFLLFMLRLVFHVHLRNLLVRRLDFHTLRMKDQPSMVHTRRPGALPGLTRAWIPLRSEAHEQGALGLTRYERDNGADPSLRPALMVHGLSAGGSTFAHAAIHGNLVQSLCASGRVAWVLELRTSNVFDKHRLRDWTLEEIACDIAPALAYVESRSGGSKVDVVAHCIGAAVFCLAALNDPQQDHDPQAVSRRVGVAVLSQVAPVLRLSPLNRLRGHLASYLTQYLGAGLLDTRPDGAGLQQTLVDVLLNAFPYPEDDDELGRYNRIARPHGKPDEEERPNVDFRTVRHRADAMFGQLFELQNLHDDALAALDAFFGAVRVKTLAQTIQYSRWGLLADEGGRNRLVSAQRLQAGMGFPLLIVHGRRNKVFDWRGSLDAHRLFKQVFIEDEGPSDVTQGGDLHLGQGTAHQLLVLDTYGHQDTLIGQAAAEDVFKSIVEFLDAPLAPQPPKATPLPVVALTPWIGPSLGWLRRASNDGRAITASIQIHPRPSRARTLALAFLVLERDDGSWRPDWTRLFFHYRRDADGQLEDLGAVLSHEALELALSEDQLAPDERMLVLTLHDDLPRGVGVPDQRKLMIASLRMSPPGDEFVKAVQAVFDGEPPCDRDLEGASFALDAAARESIDAEPAPTCCFVMASCQYPPGLLDEAVADAAWHCMDRRLAEPELPHPQWLLLLGDQVYIDETAGLFDPAPDQQRIEWVYERTRRLPAQRRVRTRLPTMSMLDDHEVYNDWQPLAQRTADEQRALDAYQDWQACLNPPPLSPHSRSFRFAPGGWPVFVLDTRTGRERRGPAGIATAEARLTDDADWQALVAWLTAQPAGVFKFIACPSVLVPLERQGPSLGVAERLASDSGSGYPRTQLDLLTLIRDQSIENVVLLAGDIHISLACTLQLAGGPRVYAIVSSALYAPWPFANERAESLVVDGPVVFSDDHRVVAGHMTRHGVWQKNGFVTVNATRSGKAKLSVEFRAADGGCERATLVP